MVKSQEKDQGYQRKVEGTELFPLNTEKRIQVKVEFDEAGKPILPNLTNASSPEDWALWEVWMRSQDKSHKN